MHLNDYDYVLPQDLIAQYPLPDRTASRLLLLNSKDGSLTHEEFKNLPEYLSSNDLLVFNDTKVIPARIPALKPSGGKTEILLERILDNKTILAQIKSSKTLKLTMRLILAANPVIRFNIKAKEQDFFTLELENANSVFEVFEIYGQVPLPPYIKRSASQLDQSRYQTVYAENPGAVAAPTAGLHFDTNLLTTISSKNIKTAFVTLHVGAGTFQPIRTNNITEHQMHSEYYQVTEEVCAQINECKHSGGRVIAVGTTTVRALESAAAEGKIKPRRCDTNIFIYPGYRFRIVDTIITNFHLPKSTLLLLISAFAGRENIMRAYAAAISKQYRFFSYGDAMMIVRGVKS